jgi:hypothetical protein
MRREMLDLTVDSELIQRLLAIGRAFDLEQGGLYDARSGVVNVWATLHSLPHSVQPFRERRAGEVEIGQGLNQGNLLPQAGCRGEAVAPQQGNRSQGTDPWHTSSN